MVDAEPAEMRKLRHALAAIRHLVGVRGSEQLRDDKVQRLEVLERGQQAPDVEALVVEGHDDGPDLVHAPGGDVVVEALEHLGREAEFVAAVVERPSFGVCLSAREQDGHPRVSPFPFLGRDVFLPVDQMARTGFALGFGVAVVVFEFDEYGLGFYDGELDDLLADLRG